MAGSGGWGVGEVGVGWVAGVAAAGAEVWVVSMAKLDRMRMAWRDAFIFEKGLVPLLEYPASKQPLPQQRYQS